MGGLIIFKQYICKIFPKESHIQQSILQIFILQQRLALLNCCLIKADLSCRLELNKNMYKNTSSSLIHLHILQLRQDLQALFLGVLDLLLERVLGHHRTCRVRTFVGFHLPRLPSCCGRPEEVGRICTFSIDNGGAFGVFLLLAALPEFAEKAEDVLFDFLVVGQFLVVVDGELAQEVLHLDVLAESDVLGVELELQPVLREVGGQVEHLELQFLHYIVAEVEDPLLNGERSILIVKVEFVVGCPLGVMQGDQILAFKGGQEG